MDGVYWAVPSKAYVNCVVAYDPAKVTPEAMNQALVDNDFPPEGPPTFPDPETFPE